MINGRTVHGLFKLPVPVLENSTCNVPPTSEHADLLRGIDLIIVDEASMIPTHALHAMDRCLRDIMQSDRPFGGKTILLGGDFRQVLPVVPRAPPAVIIDTCLKRSPMWPLFEQHQLTRNMRTKVNLQHGCSNLAMTTLQCNQKPSRYRQNVCVMVISSMRFSQHLTCKAGLSSLQRTSTAYR